MTVNFFSFMVLFLCAILTFGCGIFGFAWGGFNGERKRYFFDGLAVGFLLSCGMLFGSNYLILA